MLVTLIYIGALQLIYDMIIMLSCKITQVLLMGMFLMKQVFSVKKINTQRERVYVLS